MMERLRNDITFPNAEMLTIWIQSAIWKISTSLQKQNIALQIKKLIK